MKKITYITGSRAEYGALEAVLLKMQASRDFDVSVIVTGMHLSAEHGNTIDEIKKSTLRIAGTVEGHVEDTSTSGMAKSIGYELIGITDVLATEKPDIVLVAADRVEALAGVIAAACLNIFSAHP